LGRQEENKTMKLLYYIQGIYLSIFDEPLFDDSITKNRYGPFVERVSGRFSFIKEFDSANPLDERKADIIRDAVLHFKNKNATYLSDMSHCEDPWKSTAIREVISLAVLHDFFSLKTIEFKDIKMKYGYFYDDVSDSMSTT